MFCAGLHKVLPDLNAKIGPPLGLGMAVHGVIKIAARIGLIIAYVQPFGCQHGDGDTSGAIILIVEHPDLPRPRLFTAGKSRGKAVERKDQRRLRGIKPLGLRAVVGAVKASETRLSVRGDIAGNGVPVAYYRDKAGCGFFAVEVTHKAADGCDVGGDRVIARQQFGDNLCADINRDVFVEQFRGDAEGDVGGHRVRSMVGGADDTARLGRGNLAVSLAHLSRPAIVHHSSGKAACAASRASGVS